MKFQNCVHNTQKKPTDLPAFATVHWYRVRKSAIDDSQLGICFLLYTALQNHPVKWSKALLPNSELPIPIENIENNDGQW